MSTQKIMVQVVDWGETLKAVHIACMMARANNVPLVLLELIPTNYVGWLGTEDGLMNRDEQTRRIINDVSKTAEDYGVAVEILPFQYYAMVDAIGDAAAHANAGVVFAALPESKIPFWGAYLQWSFKRRMAHDGRTLYLAGEQVSGKALEPRAAYSVKAVSHV